MTSTLVPEELKGSELAGVAFVRDYVELLFDGPVLRCYADPVAVTGGGRVAFPAPSSRDALCSLIGRTLSDVQLSETGLTLRFDGDSTVEVDFRTEWHAGREALEFVP